MINAKVYTQVQKSASHDQERFLFHYSSYMSYFYCEILLHFYMFLLQCFMCICAQQFKKTFSRTQRNKRRDFFYFHEIIYVRQNFTEQLVSVKRLITVNYS